MERKYLLPIAQMGLLAVESPTTTPRSVAVWLRMIAAMLNVASPLRSGQDRRAVSGAWRRALHMTRHEQKAALSAQGNSHLWGPIFWQGLHNLSAIFKLSHAAQFREIIRLLPYVLPCRTCRKHAQKNVPQAFPAVVGAQNTTQAVSAVIELHNFITCKLKPAAARRLYSSPDPEVMLSQTQALLFVQDHGRSTIPSAEEARDDCGCK